MKTWITENIVIPFFGGLALAAFLFFGHIVITEVASPLYHYIFDKKTPEIKQALPIEAVRTHEPEYKWVEYARNQDTIYLYRVPAAVKIMADSTTHVTGKLIIQYSYK